MVAALKKHRKHLCTVAVVDKLPKVEEQAEDDFEGYIVKPISRENVSEKLKELLLTPREETEHRVFVIDDRANALKAVEHTLDVKGFGVTIFTEVGEAIDRTKEELTDLLITDVNVPGISGIQTCQQLKANPQTDPLPILIFTSDPSRENVQKAIESGASAFIEKPFNPKALTAKVREVLDISQE